MVASIYILKMYAVFSEGHFMYITGPQFTFTDLQARNDIDVGYANRPAMAIAIELDIPIVQTETVYSHDLGRYANGFPAHTSRDLDHHMRFTKLL